MTGDLFINGQDAYTTWGFGLENGGVSALLTPPPLKSFVTNSSRLEHGSRVVCSNPKMDEREVTLTVHFSAESLTDFFTKYSALMTILKAGSVTFELPKIQEGVVYHLLYQSCSQLRQLNQGIALFTLKMLEPNPSNRI